MKITFLGSGSAFTNDNYQSNMLIEKDGKHLLVDCGSDCRMSLRDLGYGLKDIDEIYISHAHADHVGGLEWVAFSTYFNPNVPKPKMHINQRLSIRLWEDTLKGGLESLQGKIVLLDDYFDLNLLGKNGAFVFQEIEFKLVQTVHVMDGYDIVPSYGLMFNTPNIRKVFLTTDTQFCPEQIIDFYNEADLIFHDCETAPFKSRVHAHYNDLKTLPEEVKSKIWLYHYQDGQLPNAEEDGFQGFVKKGQVFEL